MPNSTLAHIRSLTPSSIKDVRCEVTAIDEYVQTDLEYLYELRKRDGCTTLLALVGVQSHQYHRALDLAALARENGVAHCVIGGPHPITCDTSLLHDRGLSFALAEAEAVWSSILSDAISGELRPVYGGEGRWHETLNPPAVEPLPQRDLRRYILSMMGIYPARGCPYNCNFCSVVKIAGHQVRSQPVATTISSLRAAKAGGVGLVIFTSDNFNKYPEASELLEAMVEEKIRLPFFVQCDTQIYRQPEFVSLLARAGCFQMFVGVESFDRATLRAAQKFQNQPEHYAEIVSLCRSHGIATHFSNIIGFPGDTESSILEHLRMLKSLRPDAASFYILTPFPGTQQYDEFLSEGLINEQNLDRFDGTQMTWRHPNLSPGKLGQLLMRCYREFYSAGDVLSRFTAGGISWDFRGSAKFFVFPLAIQSRIAVRRHDHPMTGGIFRVRLDRVDDYFDLRRRIFGIDCHPLPNSLSFTAADQEINRRARVAI